MVEETEMREKKRNISEYIHNGNTKRLYLLRSICEKNNMLDKISELLSSTGQQRGLSHTRKS